MTLMVDGYCNRCRKPLGKVAWDSADYVFHRKCAKAEEVYTPPRRRIYLRRSYRVAGIPQV